MQKELEKSIQNTLMNAIVFSSPRASAVYKSSSIEKGCPAYKSVKAYAYMMSKRIMWR